MGKKIILVTSTQWVGTEQRDDITDLFKQSGCKTKEEYEDKYSEELFQQAIDDHGLEYWIEEEDEDE